MPRVYFAERLRSVAPPDGTNVPGFTARASLRALFAVAPLLRSYVLDERGAVRPEIVLAVDQWTLESLDAVIPSSSAFYILSSK